MQKMYKAIKAQKAFLLAASELIDASSTSSLAADAAAIELLLLCKVSLVSEIPSFSDMPLSFVLSSKSLSNEMRKCNRCLMTRRRYSFQSSCKCKL